MWLNQTIRQYLNYQYCCTLFTLKYSWKPESSAERLRGHTASILFMLIIFFASTYSGNPPCLKSWSFKRVWNKKTVVCQEQKGKRPNYITVNAHFLRPCCFNKLDGKTIPFTMSLKTLDNLLMIEDYKSETVKAFLLCKS